MAIPNVLRYLAPMVAWSAATIALGVLLGFSAVILPPMGAFGIVAVAGVVLLWVMPDLPLVSPRIRKAFFFMLIADLIIPFYYAVQFPGLPWISVRRLATFILIVPFLVAVAASSEVRRHIAERVRASFVDFHLRGRLSCCGDTFSSHVNKPDGIHLDLGRRSPVVVCAVLCDDLYS